MRCNVAVYYRVSTAAQGEGDKYGLSTQRDDVEKYCLARGHKIVQVYEDNGFSGSTHKRPGFIQMLADARGTERKWDAIVVAKWDRLARNAMLDGWVRFELDKVQVEVKSATQTNDIDPMSKAMQGMMAVFAELERSLISSRLSGGRAQKRKAGGFAGGQVPYGFQSVNGVLEELPAEQKVLTGIMAMRSDGDTLTEIAQELNDRGIFTKHGRQWHPMTIKKILDRSTNLGLYDPMGDTIP